MDDFNQQLRRHYESQRLPPGRVQEILKLGRESTAARKRRTYWRLAAAAVAILGLSLYSTTHYLIKPVKTDQTPRVATRAVATEIVSFFSNPNYQLAQVSANPSTLMDWLRLHGGPATVSIPPAMQGLSSYGCQVLDVQGQKVYLICFLLDSPLPDTASGTMPAKKMMVTVGPDGKMMKKTRPLVHLVVAPKDIFNEPPKPGERVALASEGDWNFVAWSQGDQVYLAAASLPAERLAALTTAL